MLNIRVLSSYRLKITFDGECGEFEHRNLSIFRNENTGEANANWTCLRLLATKQKIKNDSKTKKQAARLNEVFKDFFGLKVNAFGFEDGILKAKFTLNAKTENYKEQKQVITGYLDDEESDDFRDDIEY